MCSNCVYVQYVQLLHTKDLRVNTRGDEIGSNGQIIRKREEIVNDYYKSNPKAVKDEVSLPPVTKTKEVDGVNYELRGGKWYVA